MFAISSLVFFFYKISCIYICMKSCRRKILSMKLQTIIFSRRYSCFLTNQYCYYVLLFIYLQLNDIISLYKPKTTKSSGSELSLDLDWSALYPSSIQTKSMKCKPISGLGSDCTALTNPKLGRIAEWVENLLYKRSTKYRCSLSSLRKRKTCSFWVYCQGNRRMETFKSKRKAKTVENKADAAFGPLSLHCYGWQQIADKHYNKINKYTNIHLQEEAVGCFNSNPDSSSGFLTIWKSLKWPVLFETATNRSWRVPQTGCWRSWSWMSSRWSSIAIHKPRKTNVNVRIKTLRNST